MKWASGILALVVLVAGAVWWVGGFQATDPLRFDKPRARLVPGSAPMAGYVTIGNHSDSVLRLVGARSEAFEQVLLHRTVVTDGRARMIHQKDGVVIPARSRVEFRPGDLHLMLMRRKIDLKVGDPIEIELEFEGLKPTRWPVTFTVVPVTAQ